jgi:molybdenum cofactor biosynthesis enzyme MoaA
VFDFIQKLNFHEDKVNEALNDQIGSSLSTVFLDLLTNICNFNCTFCDGKSLYNLKDNSFSRDRLDSMALELSELKVDSIILVGEGGEPLIHPDFNRFSRKLLDLGINLGIYTNGSIVRKSIFATLSHFSFVRISVNAGSKETHKLIHRYTGADTFENVIKFITECSKVNQSSVGVSYVIIRENIDELYEAAKIAKECGAHYIEFKPAYGLNYSIDKELYETNIINIMAQIDLARRLESQDFKIILNNQLSYFIQNDFEHNVERITLLDAPRRCLTSKLRMVVSPTGCYLCTPKRSIKRFSFGDPQSQSLVDIWNSKEHQSLINEPCNFKCTYHEQNNKLLQLKEAKNRFKASSSEYFGQKEFL